MTKIRFDHAAGLAAAALFAFAPAQAASTTSSNSATARRPRLRSAPTAAMRAASACACSRAARASRVRSARPRRSGKRPAACRTASAEPCRSGGSSTPFICGRAGGGVRRSPWLHLLRPGSRTPATSCAGPPAPTDRAERCDRPCWRAADNGSAPPADRNRSTGSADCGRGRSTSVPLEAPPSRSATGLPAGPGRSRRAAVVPDREPIIAALGLARGRRAERQTGQKRRDDEGTLHTLLLSEDGVPRGR